VKALAARESESGIDFSLSAKMLSVNPRLT
jgi:hypothetical protein